MVNDFMFVCIKAIRLLISQIIILQSIKCRTTSKSKLLAKRTTNYRLCCFCYITLKQKSQIIDMMKSIRSILYRMTLLFLKKSIKHQGYLILLMQAEQASSESHPFQIIHFARSSKASRSRKSSANLSSNRLPPKTKKLRKMTLNPESIRQQQIPSGSSLQQHRGPGSTRPLIMEQEIDIDDFLDLEPRVQQSTVNWGWSKREIQSNEIVGLQYIEGEEKHDFFKEI